MYIVYCISVGTLYCVGELPIRILQFVLFRLCMCYCIVCVCTGVRLLPPGENPTAVRNNNNNNNNNNNMWRPWVLHMNIY
jgi:hypothetical protein